MSLFLRRASEVFSAEESRWNFWPFHPYVPMIVKTNASKTLIYQHNHMCLNLYVLLEGVYILHICCHQVKVNFHISVMRLLDFRIFHKKCMPYIVGCPQDNVIPELVWNTIPMWSRIVEHHQNWFIWVIWFYPFEIFDCISKDNTVVLFELCEHMFWSRSQPDLGLSS